jgi:hypothetical protein
MNHIGLKGYEPPEQLRLPLQFPGFSSATPRHRATSQLEKPAQIAPRNAF